MDEIRKYQYIASLITKEYLGTIDETEKKELEHWKMTSNNHLKLYDQLKQKDYTEDIKRYHQIDVEAGWKKYKKRHKNTVRSIIYRWRNIAAIAFVLIGLSICLLYHDNKSEIEVAVIHPGSSKAILTLGDGSVHELGKTRHHKLIHLSEVTIRNTGNELFYARDRRDSFPHTLTKEVYNNLKIPTGGEYQLTLSDGSRIWLNSETQIRYPENFSGTERRIFLEGEAYFEVAHDSKHPFIIELQGGVNVQVLGTSFNVKAYEDEKVVETVLEKGAVKMWKDTANIILIPGNKAVYNKTNGGMTLEKVDTELYTAWRNGQYIFRNETVENILLRLSRWYGMDVFYSNEEVKKIIFSGNVQKYNTVHHLLEAMELSGGVHFDIKGTTILVSRGNK